MRNRDQRSEAGDASVPLLEAIKVEALPAGRAESGLALYVVVESPKAARKHGDKRRGARRRTRLRSGKILDLSYAFVTECLLYDRSAGGARIRLVRNVALPARFRLYDDEQETLTLAEVAWRRDRDLGVRVGAAARPAPADRLAIVAMGGKYYALSE